MWRGGEVAGVFPEHCIGSRYRKESKMSAIRLRVPLSARRRLYAVIEFDADEMKVKSPGTIPWRLQMLAGRRGRVVCQKPWSEAMLGAKNAAIATQLFVVPALLPPVRL